MKLETLRGLGAAAFFALVLFALIPIYVPRPNFIPGFAPPPDFWPRIVCWVGIAVGLISAAMAVGGQTPAVDPDEAERADDPIPRMLLRFGLAVVVLVLFPVLVDLAGFLIASMLLTGAAILLTGERTLWIAAVACVLVLPFGLDLFFGEALGTQFPPGSLFR